MEIFQANNDNNNYLLSRAKLGSEVRIRKQILILGISELGGGLFCLCAPSSCFPVARRDRWKMLCPAVLLWKLEWRSGSLFFSGINGTLIGLPVKCKGKPSWFHFPLPVPSWKQNLVCYDSVAGFCKNKSQPRSQASSEFWSGWAMCAYFLSPWVPFHFTCKSLALLP